MSEPDRPSIGLQTVSVGQWVVHRKWGIGRVLRVEDIDGHTAARIEFYDLDLENDSHPQRTVTLGGGYLLDAEEALRGAPDEHAG